MKEHDDSKSSPLRILYSIALLWFSASFLHKDASQTIKIKNVSFSFNTDFRIPREILISFSRRLGLQAIDFFFFLHQMRDTQLTSAPHNMAGCLHFPSAIKNLQKYMKDFKLYIAFWVHNPWRIIILYLARSMNSVSIIRLRYTSVDTSMTTDVMSNVVTRRKVNTVSINNSHWVRWHLR